MNRRQTERLPLSRAGTMDTRRYSQSVRTVDISQVGACVACNTSTVAIGDQVILTVGAMRARGSIAWTSMDRVGIQFAAEVPRATIDLLVA